MSPKPRLQVFLQNLSDQKAAEVARRMPFLKKDFKVGVTFIRAEDPSEGVFADSGIPLTGLRLEPLPPDDPLTHSRTFFDAFQEDRPDVALAALPGPCAAAFLIAARAAGVPVVAAELDDQPCMISSFEELSSLYFSDMILPATRTLRRILMQALPQLADRLGILLPHSADTTYIQLTKEDRHRLRKNLRVDTELKMVTMIAPFDRRRDHDTLLEACALLKQRGYNFILLLVGDGPERQRLAEKVYALRLEDQVCIMDDPGDHIDILCATDIFALCTHFEGNSIPLIEAMAQGLAIAATDVSGINDLIRDGRSGRLAQPKNPESFAQALADLLAQEKIRKKLGSVGRKCIENRGNLSQFMPPLISTLKKKIKEKSAAGTEGAGQTGSRDLGHQYLTFQQKIRRLWKQPISNFSIEQAADLLDGFPINVQVDILEKMCNIPVDSGPLAMFVRPLEKVLSERFFDQLPMLEMRLLEKLAGFYIDLGYLEGAEKLIEQMESGVGKELFRYHFACNRFSGLRANVRLSQLYDFVGQQDRRDFYRLELWEYLNGNRQDGNDYFHQQNAAFLASLGEAKLAMREIEKDSLQAIPIHTEVAVVSGVPDEKVGGRKPKLKTVALRPVVKQPGASSRTKQKESKQLQNA